MSDLIERLRAHPNKFIGHWEDWADEADTLLREAAAALEAEASEGERRGLERAIEAIEGTSHVVNVEGDMQAWCDGYDFAEEAAVKAIRALIPEAPAQPELASAAANQISTTEFGLQEAPVRDVWQPIETAPKDGTVVWVWCPAYEGLRALTSLCSWHEDAGWCVDELRTPTMWCPLQVPASPPQDREG